MGIRVCDRPDIRRYTADGEIERLQKIVAKVGTITRRRCPAVQRIADIQAVIHSDVSPALVVCPFAAEGTCHVSERCGHSVPHERRIRNDDPCGWDHPDHGCPDCRTHNTAICDINDVSPCGDCNTNNEQKKGS